MLKARKKRFVMFESEVTSLFMHKNLLLYSGTCSCTIETKSIFTLKFDCIVEKSGNQCCYGTDGLLRYSEDTFQGSTPDRFHDWGADPYGTPGSVPSLSHGLADVMTFFYCCMWVDYKDCDFYMDVRPTTDCKYYKPPKQGNCQLKTPIYCND